MYTTIRITPTQLNVNCKCYQFTLLSVSDNRSGLEQDKVALDNRLSGTHVSVCVVPSPLGSSVPKTGEIGLLVRFFCT